MRKLLLITLWIFIPGSAAAQDPKQDWVPVPREELPFFVLPERPPALGQRNVWELYAVDSTGRFRPRVVQTPQGSFYLSNGQPYPWTSTNSLPFMPYAVD